MVIGFQIRKLHRGAESAPPAVLDSKKPGLFRVKVSLIRYMKDRHVDTKNRYNLYQVNEGLIRQ